MKRIIAALLVFVLVLAALPAAAQAEKQQSVRGQLVTEEAERIYRKCLSTSGKRSFAGFCGLMTSHQLYNMGINDTLIVCDGNKQYDYYKGIDITSGGYYVRPYSAANYSLEQALNTISRNGNQDVYNLLVGFQWTNTEAGARYGHAVLINAILDGTVYFVESFNYCFGKISCKEGKMLTCSIKEFADYFNSWTKFDGIIYFGEKQYSAACQVYNTNVFLRTRFESNLRSQPCLVGENECQRQRHLAAGEVLHATAVCKNSQGELFYQVEDGETIGYVSANAVSFLEVNKEDMALQGQLPETVALGQDISLTGSVTAAYSNLTQMGVTVTNAAGETVLAAQLDIDGAQASLEQLNEMLAFDTLPEGGYQLSVWAQSSNILVKETGFTSQNVTVSLRKQSLTVGAGEVAQVSGGEEQKDGWFFANGKWYCYTNGQPCTGWVTRFGVEYYLLEDGSVATGFLDMDGLQWYFSATGAMCTGWQELDGVWYLFDSNGLLIKEGTSPETEE